MTGTELDYYAILNISRNATHEEITLAYRKLAIRLCPFRDAKHQRDFVPLAQGDELTHMKPLSLQRQWEYINMAYDVLGNELHRAIYDRFGEAALFQGMLLPNGYFPPYQYHGDNLKVYHNVFGSYSPYANVIDVVTQPPILYSTAEHGIGVRTKDAPVEKIINLDLEEVRFGSVKLMHVWRQEFADAQQIRTEKKKKTLKLEIPPGTTPGTRFCFKEEGDRCPTKIPADIIFITADKPHATFQRRHHHDLVYKHQIDLCQALTGFKFKIDTLDKRQLKVSITDIVKPGYTKIIPCEGLPKCKVEATSSKLLGEQRNDFGDLIIEFEIKFPNFLNNAMKLHCRAFFADLNEMAKHADPAENPILRLIQRNRRV